MAKQLLWRIGVAAIGLVAAVAVGWRLSPTITVLVIVCAWLPLGVWCLFAPRIPAALPIALALLVAIATIWWTLPGRPGDRTVTIAWSTLMWYSLPGGLALLAATWRPRWLGDRTGADPAGPPARPVWRRVTATLVAAGVLVSGCGLPGLFWGAVGVPSSDELFPLPPGMDATSATGPDGANGCDQTGHACWTYYRITGATGESTAVLTERLRRHLQEAKGWGGPESCRPVRRFTRPTATDLCITVTSDPAGTVDRPTIGVELSRSNIGPPTVS
ncbi:hypothetical protein [Dactylosporangium darangshiense]|uniref:hypothetical protein n=1 Tax=Dactylosporangium darangshiense TaxID=579108 RepID=UPI0031ECA047